MSKHEERIERFNKLKYTKNKSEWEQFIKDREEDIYYGKDIDDTLDIMEIIDEYYDKVSNKLKEQEHSGASMSMLEIMIKRFHKCENTINDF